MVTRKLQKFIPLDTLRDRMKKSIQLQQKRYTAFHLHCFETYFKTIKKLKDKRNSQKQFFQKYETIIAYEKRRINKVQVLIDELKLQKLNIQEKTTATEASFRNAMDKHGEFDV